MKDVNFEVEYVPAVASVIKALFNGAKGLALGIGGMALLISVSQCIDQLVDEKKYNFEKKKEQDKRYKDYRNYCEREESK